MTNKQLFWGIILLFIGIIALLANLDVFNFSWHIAWKLWPLILIIIGIVILPTNDNIKVLLVALTLCLGGLLYYYKSCHRETNEPITAIKCIDNQLFTARHENNTHMDIS